MLYFDIYRSLKNKGTRTDQLSEYMYLSLNFQKKKLQIPKDNNNFNSFI